MTLTASYYYLAEDHFKCEEKRKRVEKRVGKEKASKIMEVENGCGKNRQEPRFTIDGIHFHQCVCGYKSDRLGFYLDLLEKLNKGILPFEGSYLDQPAKVIEIINRLSFLKADIEARQIEKANKGK